jgi:methylated-DNA-[protein]-cysteine S-methyltransferase
MNDYRFFVERVPTPSGTMLLVTDEQERLRALDWEDHEVRMHRLLRLHYGVQLTRLEANARVSNARRAVEAYYGGAVSAIDILHVKTGGTDFQREVWTALRAIPVGETTTYGRLAALLGRPKARRAVGMANGANPSGCRRSLPSGDRRKRDPYRLRGRHRTKALAIGARRRGAA